MSQTNSNTVMLQVYKKIMNLKEPQIISNKNELQFDNKF
jgi:hypothetical protein